MMSSQCLWPLVLAVREALQTLLAKLIVPRSNILQVLSVTTCPFMPDVAGLRPKQNIMCTASVTSVMTAVTWAAQST